MSMNDDEFDMVNKGCNEFLKKDKIGKIMSSDLKHILERIFLEGYELGKKNRKPRISPKLNLADIEEFNS